MKSNSTLFDFILREWLLIAAVSGLAATSFYLKKVPVFLMPELQVLFLLWLLFVAIKGLENSGIMSKCSQVIEKGRFVPLKLVVLTFILSAFVTNDVALIIIVPLTLSLNITRKDILVILEAFAANAGSALTPIGNPQNLLIYWFFHITPLDFIKSIAPFSVLFLLFLIIVSITVRTQNNKASQPRKAVTRRAVYIYGVLLVLVDLIVLHILPIAVGALVLVYAFLFDRKALRVDYFLLITFLCFFGIADNIRTLLVSNLEHTDHVFIFSALSSQVMGNVPVALLFAKFTTQWKALIWGTNVGGFGSLVASFANLIAYKFYIAHEDSDNVKSFTIKFVVYGYVMFFMGIGLYLIMF